MKVYRDLNSLPQFKGSVISIGSFDGVHAGHQQLLAQLTQLAHQYKSESVIITFDPHPREVIYPKDDSLRLLTSLHEKLLYLQKYGIDNVVVIPFTVEFSQQIPREYVEKFLIQKFNPSHIVIGYDHRFGLNRGGNINLLRDYESRGIFNIIEIKKQQLDEIIISSTVIRKAVEDGEMETANQLLKHFYRISGRVIHGNKVGTDLGFPTANLSIDGKNKLLPKDGIYSCLVTVDGVIFKGMLYIGNRPSLQKYYGKSIEVNVFDFDGNLYDKLIDVDVVQYLREDEKFNSLEELSMALGRDKEKAMASLEGYKFKSLEKSLGIAIAILNYNGREHLESYLPSVLHSSIKYDIEYFLVDNGSTDDSINYVTEWHPEFKIIPLRENHGFAQGYNLGINEIDAEYVVLLNSDILVDSPWIDDIIDLMEKDSEVAACQPKILSLMEKDQFEYAGAAGGYMDMLDYPFCRGRIFDLVEKDKNQYDGNYPVHWTSGAAMVVRKSVFQSLGGFDPWFFAHHEEIDICNRIQRAGYKLMAVNSVHVFHLGGGTLAYDNSRKVYLNFRNNIASMIKNHGVSRLIWLLPCRFLLDIIASFKFLLSGSIGSAWAVLRSYLSVLYHSPSILQRKRNDSDLIINLSKGKDYGLPRSRKSIVYQYFILGRRTYSKIMDS